MFAFLMQVRAKGTSQTVTLSVTNVPLQQIFEKIHQQTGYNFLFTYEILEKAGPATIRVKDATIQQALNDALEGKALDYTIVQNTIVIQPGRSVPLIEPVTLGPPPLDIMGTVRNEAGTPLEGVSVIVKGSTKGTATNERGAYFLDDVDENATLVFSMVGYKSRTVSVNGRNVINLTLSIELAHQEEIVVASTGYQTISKERATGSFDIINSDQLDNPTTNIGSRIVGQAAGVQATIDENGNPTFQIRGLTSLYAASAPLIVVDGFAIQGDFNSINPNDVESITILKDAAAASIWGARSANGVIVITTKRAKKGTPLKVDLNVFTKIGQKFDLDYVNPLATSAETIEYEQLLFNKNWSPLNNSGSLNHYFYAYSQASTAINEFKLGFISEAEMNKRLDHLKTISNKQQISDYLLSNPISTQVNLNLYGGSERMSNFLSLLYETNQSNFTGTYFNRYMMNYRSSSKIFKWLDFNLSGMVQYNDIHNNGVSLGDIQGLSPYDMLLDEDGNYTNINRYYWPVMERYVPMSEFPYASWEYNPLQEIRNRDRATKHFNMRIQGGLTFHIIDGLDFDSKLQYERITSENRYLYNDETYYVRSTINEASSWDPSTNEITPNLPMGAILSQSTSEVEAYNFRNQINFNREFAGKHEIAFVAGSEINDIVSKSNSYPTTYGYNDETLTVGVFPNGPGGSYHRITNWQGRGQDFDYTNSFYYRTDRYFSLYGNLAYTYLGKYTISGSARTDASNLITDDPQYRYEPFWSVGAGWNMMKEQFMQGASWIDDLRLRLTYGYNGNVDKSTAFRPLISLGSTPDNYTHDYQARISSYGNPTLRWEKTGTWNIGADFSFIGGKLFGKLDVYQKNGKDLIAPISIPAVNGTTRQKLNNAAMVNKGIELTLGTRLNLKGNDITWRGSMNFAYNKNKITDLFVAQYAAYSLLGGSYVEGKNANTMWTFEYAGIRAADNQPIVKGAGKDVYDFNGWTPGDGRDYLLDMGTTVAPYLLGFTSQFKIYDFDLSFLLTGKFGHVFKRQSFNYPPLWVGRVLPNNSLTEVMNGDPQKIVPLPINETESRYYFWDRFYGDLNYLVVNASYIRMQELNLTYHLPDHLLNKVNVVGDFSIYAQGNNLFTILANKYGEDPEYPMGSMKPMPRYTFGARFHF